MSEEKIINRIKKMMALANDPAASDGERENALRMSYALLAKHNLDLADVQGKPVGPQEAREQEQAEFYARPWALSLAQSIADLFFCKYYIRRSATKDMAFHVFTGKESNAQAALEVAETLIHSIKREASRLMRQKNENATWRRSFATGAMFKIRARVLELMTADPSGMATGTSLALIDLRGSEKAANELYIANQGVTVKVTASKAKKTVNSDAYQAGKEFGSKLNLSATKKLS
jgi:hypothetical protein